MKYIIRIVFLVTLFFDCKAQKHKLDTADIIDWTRVNNGNISSDGKYVFYSINNNFQNYSNLIVKSTNSIWEGTYMGLNSEGACFSANSKFLFFKGMNDTLFSLNLRNKFIFKIPNVSTYQEVEFLKKEWLLVEERKSKKINFIEIGGRRMHILNNVVNWWLDKQRNCLILLADTLVGSQRVNQLFYLDLDEPDFKKKLLYSLPTSRKLDALVFSSNGKKIAFLERDSLSNTRLLTCSLVDCKAQSILSDNEGRAISNIIKYNDEGDILFLKFKCRRKSNREPFPNRLPSVDVWNYKDFLLQSYQLIHSDDSPEYVGSVNTNDPQIFQLTNGYDKIDISPDGNWFYINRRLGDPSEGHWNDAGKEEFFLMNSYDTNKVSIGSNISRISFSPGSKFLITCDRGFSDWYIYDLRNGRSKNITQNIPIPIKDGKFSRARSYNSRGLQLIGWLKEDSKILFYDSYDIWLVDPNSIELPVCLTNGNGRKNNITFRFSEDFSIVSSYLFKRQSILLSAFNHLTKTNSFYWLYPQKNNLLTEISSCNCVNDNPSMFGNFSPVKASNSSEYLIRHMSINEAPNYYITKDFKAFNKISDVNPHKKLNWIKSSLLTYEDLDNGGYLQGVLYLPENFDSNRKYPVIVTFYEQKSDEVFQFKDIEFVGAGIDCMVPWFTGRGYLVYTVDIKYKLGWPGKSALQSVNRGVDKLVTLPFVDSTNIGIQGHSFGGYEVNYILTHSNRFKAAVSACGVSDFIRWHGSLTSDGSSQQGVIERDQLRMGASLWEQKELYIKNSPIFDVDKINTPILLVANKNDEIVPFDQGVEFFVSLRRLKKPAWLLQYDNEGHVLSNMFNVLDYLTRMDQFFGHYLKGDFLPIWMSQGIPASKKGQTLGYEKDTSFSK